MLDTSKRRDVAGGRDFRERAQSREGGERLLYLNHHHGRLEQASIKHRSSYHFFALYLTGACRLKNANPSKQEHARLEVENAEDDLVQKTEVAITLMKTVLENVSPILTLHFSLLIVTMQPEPLKNLNELAKSQLMFYAAAAEALSSVQGEIEELSVAAEGEYRA